MWCYVMLLKGADAFGQFDEISVEIFSCWYDGYNSLDTSRREKLLKSVTPTSPCLEYLMDNTGTLRWCQDVFPTGPLPTCCQYADHAEANLAYGPFAVRLMCSFAAIFLYVWNFKSYFTNFAPLRFLRQIFLYHFSVGETPCRSKRKSSSSSNEMWENFKHTVIDGMNLFIPRGNQRLKRSNKNHQPFNNELKRLITVSYTHLTLPTIYSV